MKRQNYIFLVLRVMWFLQMQYSVYEAAALLLMIRK